MEDVLQQVDTRSSSQRMMTMVTSMTELLVRDMHDICSLYCLLQLSNQYFLHHANSADMQAIYAAFNENQIACNDLTVKDSGCSAKPTAKPIVTTVAGNQSVRLEWDTVTGAVGYEVLRSDGGVFGCDQGKFLLTGDLAGTITTNTFWQDTGLQNGREVSLVHIFVCASLFVTLCKISILTNVPMHITTVLLPCHSKR